MPTATPTPIRRHPGVILTEDFDPTRRLAAHLELGRRASARGDVSIAVTHFEEALGLDPTDERPRAELRGLGKLAGQSTRRRWFPWFS